MDRVSHSTNISDIITVVIPLCSASELPLNEADFSLLISVSTMFAYRWMLFILEWACKYEGWKASSNRPPLVEVIFTKVEIESFNSIVNSECNGTAFVALTETLMNCDLSPSATITVTNKIYGGMVTCDQGKQINVTSWQCKMTDIMTMEIIHNKNI